MDNTSWEFENKAKEYVYKMTEEEKNEYFILLKIAKSYCDRRQPSRELLKQLELYPNYYSD